MSACRIIFVAGTDTGVGKTLLTAHLLFRLRQSGCRALAMKPFCSGGRGDVRLLRALQEDELTTEQINPYFFSPAVAPLAAIRRGARDIPLAEVIERISVIGDRCDVLLIEGAGGVMVPLGRGYFIRDLMVALRCEVLLVARDKLGTINHTLLSCQALHVAGIRAIKVVLSGAPNPDDSCKTNREILREMMPSMLICALPYLGTRAKTAEAVKKNDKKIKKTVACLLDRDYCPALSGARGDHRTKKVR